MSLDQWPEILGWAATVGAVVGVVANNKRLRWCFLVWLGTNAASCGLHVRGLLLGDQAMLALAVRDGVFLLLAVHGWVAWGRSKHV